MGMERFLTSSHVSHNVTNRDGGRIPQVARTTRTEATSFLRELARARTTSKEKYHAPPCSYALSLTNMPLQGPLGRLATPAHHRPTRASKLASPSMNHRAPKFDSFLTRVHRHLPCDARLVSRWLFLFRAQWRSLCLCRAERHSKIARLGF